MSASDMVNRERLAELLLKWEEAWEHGEDIPASRLCPDQPDMAVELQRRIDRLKRMAWMAAGEEGGGDGQNEEPAPPTDPRVGTTLNGRYRLDAVIAEGGFGRVYRAFDLELHRPVAVKLATTKPETTGQEELLAEARRAAKLRHPGIVPVHDVGREGNVVFIVADLIDGRSLAEVIATARPAPRDAARLVADVAEALHHAHEEGFVHRDIKPANILIDHQGRPLVTDFGLAADVEQVARGDGAGSGTLPYMAPEQVAGEAQLIGPRSDLYALGVVLYELLTGRLPYQARTPTALREQILFRQSAPVRSLSPLVSPQLEQTCLRCLAKHPADRFADAAELARTLRSSPTRAAPRLPRRVLLAVLVAAVFVAGLVLGRVIAPLPTTERQPSGEATHEAGVLVFDGSSRIVTPLERFAPVTLEAWVQPKFYPRQDCQFVIGSDIPTKHGIGLAMCEALLSAEYIAGMVHSEGAIPLDGWSHVAVVFGDNETRLYLNGHRVGAGPATKAEGGTTFVVGNVGRSNPINFWVGKVRAVRVSKGERYAGDFVPEEKFKKDADDAPVRAVLIYDGAAVEGDRVIDLSGAGNHGRWERTRP
jgi:hypothetical protein